MTPSLTEILFELGVGPRIAAVTRNDNYPPEVKNLPKVGDMVLDYEAILGKKPDLVVLDPGLNGDQGAKLRRLGLPVAEVSSQSVSSLRSAILALGNLTDTAAQGSQLVAQLDLFLQKARERKASLKRRPRVFIEIAEQPLMTAGGGTYVDELLELAGGANVYEDHHGYASVSLENLLSLQPDVIILTQQNPDDLKGKPGWSALEAVRRGRVYRLNEDLIVRPTLRMQQAITQLEGWLSPLHPRLGG